MSLDEVKKEKVRMELKFNPSTPLQISATLFNDHKFDIWFGTYWTPWDLEANVFAFYYPPLGGRRKSGGDLGSEYIGVKVKREAMKKVKDAWIKVESGKSVSIDLDLSKRYKIKDDYRLQKVMKVLLLKRFITIAVSDKMNEKKRITAKEITLQYKRILIKE